jgi:tetratricopeptide (TPR) repeat protein
MLTLAFYSFAYGIDIGGVSSSDERFFKEINEISVKIDAAKNKKEEIKLLERLAEILVSGGQYGHALDIYYRLLKYKKVPRSKKFKYYVKLGDIYGLEKNYGPSLECYKKASFLYKRDIYVRLKLGDMFLKSNLYNLAEKSFLEVLAVDGNLDSAKKGLGDVFYYQHINTKAVYYYNQIDPKNYDKETVIKIVNCYRDLNRIDDAMKILSAFAEEYKDTELFFLFGLLFADKKEYLKAEDMFLKAIECDKRNFKVYVYLASIYNLMGEIHKAKKISDEAYSMNSSYATVDLIQAEIAYKMGKLYEAERYAFNAYTKAKTVFVKEQAQKMIDFLNKRRV